MSDFPSSDEIARAIVTACRQLCGVDPLDVASGGLGYMNQRARHYANHALAFIYGKANRNALARCLGAKNASQFVHQTGASVRNMGGKTFATWWSPGTFDAVVRAIEAERTRIAVAPKRPTERLSANLGGYLSENAGYREPGKRALDAMLAEAAANTAKLQNGKG